MSETTKKTVSDSDTIKKNKTTAAKTSTASVEKKEGTLVYLGPNIKGIVYHGDVLRDGGSALLDAQIQKVPVLKELLVPVSSASEKFAELKKGGAISKLYEAAKSQLKKGE